jgi:hypothetical protein
MDGLELHVNPAGLDEHWEIRAVFVQKQFKTAHAIEDELRLWRYEGSIPWVPPIQF